MIVFEHSYFDSLLFCFRREKKNGIFFVITRAAAALFETTFDTITSLQRYIQCCHSITRKSSISSSKRWCVRVYCRYSVLMLPLHTFNQADIVVLFLLSFQYFTFFCSFQHSSMQFSLECACFFLSSFSFGFKVHSIFFCGIIYRFAIAANTHSLRWFEYDSLYNFAYSSYPLKLTHSKCAISVFLLQTDYFAFYHFVGVSV